jgi:hypothetical protein
MNFSVKLVGLSLFSIALVGFFNSCKQTNNDKYFYNANRDSISPKIVTSVPLQNATYAFGQDIHMVGVVTDLESTNKGGKLQTLTVNLSQVTAADHQIINTYLNATPDVDGKEGYTFNEKWAIVSGSSTVFCRLLVTAKDYAGRVTKDSVFFSVQ